MEINARINVNLDRLIDKINEEIKNKIYSNFINLVPKIKEFVKNLIKEGLDNSNEYQSILYGRLRVEFGIVNPLAALKSITQALQESAVVELFPANNTSLGSIRIGIFKDNFTDAISAEGAKYNSVNKNGRSLPIEWLRWLLFEGDAIIITEYGISERPAKGSRTGASIMIKTKKDGKLIPWRVPPQFSGISSDNMITRVALKIGPKLKDYLEIEARKLLNG